MLRYRLEYLYIPKSARLRFTVLVPGPESVGHYQAERAGDEWLHLACPPLYRWDLVRLSAVFAREEPESIIVLPWSKVTGESGLMPAYIVREL